MYTFALNRLYWRKLALFIISQDRQTQVFAANAMAAIIIMYYNS